MYLQIKLSPNCEPLGTLSEGLESRFLPLSGAWKLLDSVDLGVDDDVGVFGPEGPLKKDYRSLNRT